MALVLLALSTAVAAPPVASVERRTKLVEAWFRDVVGRPGAPSEHLYWVNLLAGHPPLAVAGGFVRGPEVQARVYREISQRAFGDVREHEVKAFYDSWQKRHFVRTEARVRIVAGPGLVRKGADTPAARLNAVHLLMLGRPATRAEAEGWSLVMAKGMPLIGVCHQLERSDESRVGRVTELRRELLGRVPTAQEVTQLLENLKAGACEEDLIATVIVSDEYALKNRLPVDAPRGAH